MLLDDPTTRVEIKTPHREELAIIDKMMELLRTPSNWCKGKRSSYGRFCLLGALAASKGGHAEGNVNKNDLVKCRLEEIAGDHVTLFNDRYNTSHKDIISLLVRARASFE